MDTSSSTIYLVRHGIRLNQEVPAWGRTAERPDDTPLSANGIRQAHETAAWILAHASDIRHIFASPFYRAVQTAQPIADILTLPIWIEPGFSEWLNPQWQKEQARLLSPAALQQEFPRVATGYVSVGRAVYPEFDENREVFARVKKTVVMLTATYPGALLIVAHGATIVQAARALTGSADGLDCHMCAVNKLVLSQRGWHLVEATRQHLSVSEDTIQFS